MRDHDLQAVWKVLFSFFLKLTKWLKEKKSSDSKKEFDSNSFLFQLFQKFLMNKLKSSFSTVFSLFFSKHNVFYEENWLWKNSFFYSDFLGNFSWFQKERVKKTWFTTLFLLVSLGKLMTGKIEKKSSFHTACSKQLWQIFALTRYPVLLFRYT